MRYADSPAVIAGVLMLLASPASAYEICGSAEDCLARGQAAADNVAALEFLTAAADLASGADDQTVLFSAFEALVRRNLALAKPLVAHAWAQAARAHYVAYGDDGRAENTRELVALAEKALPPFDGERRLAGTYWGYAGHGHWSEMRISDHADGTLLMDWFLLRFGTVPSAYDYGPAAMWEMSAGGSYRTGEMIISYAGSDDRICELKFTRAGLGLEWTYPEAQDLPQACRIGGANVFPHGHFWLVDQTDPNLDDAED